MALRSSWEGFLKLNLLSVPVKAYSVNVGGRNKIAFHQIHAGCGSRIRHQKVCPVHGEVTKDEVVSGYEYAKGKYVLIEPEELNKVRKEDDKSITIDLFIHPDALDPIYFTGRSFYLTPDGAVGQKPYEVLQRVMKDQQRYAVVRIILSGRQQIALVRPVEGLLVMSILNYDDQVKKPSAFRDETPDQKVSKKELELAEMLVQASTSDEFNLAQYHDEYEAEMTALIEAKSKGKKIVDRRSAEEPSIINLMDALKKSLDQKHKAEKKQPAHRSAKRKTG